MQFFKRRIKWKILRKFAATLPGELAGRYGRTDSYSPMQVQKTLEDGNYPHKYRGYAFALCLSEADAIQHLGDAAIVTDLRREWADELFAGNQEYSLNDVLKFSSSGGNPSTNSAAAVGD